MITAKELYDTFLSHQIHTFFGVPDSLIKNFTDYLMEVSVLHKEHFIAANEGNAVAMACGSYLATGRYSLVYMQNSGLANAYNAIVSLAHPKVYDIPMVYMIGWRGQPQTKDEPQHARQGEITLSTLELLDIPYFIVTKTTEPIEIESCLKEAISNHSSIAFVVEKDSILKSCKHPRGNELPKLRLSREQAIKIIVDTIHENDIIVTTTGKCSRELFEYKEKKKMKHHQDFLTVGSMGHASSIAFGIALHTKKRVWCIDGDGALIMHMGAAAFIAGQKPETLVHVIINNNSHESVGGLPTFTDKINLTEIFKAYGYPCVYNPKTEAELKQALLYTMDAKLLTCIIINTNTDSRDDLGRPTISPIENKKALMNFIHESR